MQERDSVSSGCPNTEKRVEKNEVQPSFFKEPWGVWIPDGTLFQVFDMASQTIDNSWRNSRQKFTKFYGS